MRRIRRLPAALAVGVLALFAAPQPAHAGQPTVYSVIEGQESGATDKVIVLFGDRVSSFRGGTIWKDGAEVGDLVRLARSRSLSVMVVPATVTEQGLYLLRLEWGSRRNPKIFEVTVDLTFGALPTDSVSQAAIQMAVQDDFDDAETLNGWDAAYFTDASNVSAGTLGLGFFSAYDDLVDEGKVGAAADQVAAGDHSHDAAYATRTELMTSGTLNDPGNPVDWSQLKNVPQELADGMDGGFTSAGDGLTSSGAAVAVDYGGSAGDFGAALTISRSDHIHDGRYFTETELMSAGTVNDPTNPVTWTKLKDVPAGFADGADADTTYTAGTGLSLTSTAFSVDFAGSGSATTASRSDHAHAWSSLTGVPSDLADGDDDTTYAAGTGLSLASTTFSVNYGGNGSAATASRSDHSHAWSTLTSVPAGFADDVDDDTTYSAGTGLALAGTTLSADFAGTGSAATVSHSDHDHDLDYAQVSHGHDWTDLINIPPDLDDGDDDTTYTPGNGLTLTGTDFAVDFLGTGSAGTAARSDHDHDLSYASVSHAHAWTSLTGIPADIADGDQDTTYTPGAGLLLTSGKFDLDFTGTGSSALPAHSDHDHDGTYAFDAHVHDWVDLTGVPADIADGDDFASAGLGLIDSGGTFDVDFAGPGSSNQAAHSDHDHDLQYIGTGGGSVTGALSVTNTATFNAHTIHGVNQSTTGFSCGVRGEATATTGRGVLGLGTATTGSNIGVRGEVVSPIGVGVYGANTASTGFGSAIGVQGFSQSHLDGIGVVGAANGGNGKGVWGSAGHTTGNTNGVHGEARSSLGRGVFGENTAASGGIGVVGTASATTGAPIGVQGQVGNSNGAGVFGSNTATTGPSAGVLGQTVSTTGRGVIGEHKTTTGIGYGVQGQSDSATGVGVFGSVIESTGVNYAVRGDTLSPLGTGVAGFNSAGTGNAIGVAGQSSSITGRGVYGVGVTTTGANFGVYGATQSSVGTAVFGTTGTIAVGQCYAVRGETQSGSGFGVYGSNTSILNAVAVQGSATGTSGVNSGVSGSSASTSGRGVLGIASATTGITTGVMGVANSRSLGARGVFASNTATSGTTYGLDARVSSPTGRAVSASQTSTSAATGYGVFASAASLNGRAVYGTASSTTGSNIGVHGDTRSSAGIGVEATANLLGAYALRATNTQSYAVGANLKPDIALFRGATPGTGAIVNKARIDADGKGFFNGGTQASGADFAESVEVNRPKKDFEPGDVMVVDTEGRRRFAKSSGRNSKLVAGVYATRPGVLLRPGQVTDPSKWIHKEIPMAITGIVPCKVCDENGAVKAGDLLVTSSTPGYAMKAPEDPKAGTLVGKALEPLEGERGKVEILITMR